MFALRNIKYQTVNRLTSKTLARSYIPMVIDQHGCTERTYDIYSRLLADRIVLLFGPVETNLAASIIAQLLFLESADDKRPIYMYINSPGGHVSDGLAIYDTMQYVKSPISTVCMGMAASMGSFLLSAGNKGSRYALPNAKVMVHQPSGGASGQATDIAILAKEILKTRTQLNRLYSEHTGQAVEEIEKSMERDYWMSPEEAKSFGIIDSILKHKNEAILPDLDNTKTKESLTMTQTGTES